MAETSKETAAARGRKRREEMVHVWPHLVSTELLAALAVTIILLLWSLLADAPLEGPVDPSQSLNPAKAPWYFVGLQELLVYFDPWIAGVMIPILIILGLMAIPYLDFNTKGEGRYSFSPRKFAVTVFLFGYLLWLILIAIGARFRGPGWVWYWPWEDWAIHKPVFEKTWSFPLYIGLPLLILYFSLGLIIPRRINKKFYEELGLIRYLIVMLLVLSMIGVPVKILLRLIFGVHYILQTPWFNI